MHAHFAIVAGYINSTLKPLNFNKPKLYKLNQNRNKSKAITEKNLTEYNAIHLDVFCLIGLISGCTCFHLAIFAVQKDLFTTSRLLDDEVLKLMTSPIYWEWTALMCAISKQVNKDVHLLMQKFSSRIIKLSFCFCLFLHVTIDT